MGDVLLLNACGTQLGLIDWQRAVTMLVTVDGSGLPVAVLHEADPERQVRSPSTVVPLPRAIRLSRWVYVRFLDGRDLAGGGVATRQGVLTRDKRTCIYCGARADTVDHLLPQSRGGRNTWENLAACCQRCNHRKADRTPEEAGMRLRWHPWRPDVTGPRQRRIWRELARQEQQLASA